MKLIKWSRFSGRINQTVLIARVPIHPTKPEETKEVTFMKMDGDWIRIPSCCLGTPGQHTQLDVFDRRIRLGYEDHLRGHIDIKGDKVPEKYFLDRDQGAHWYKIPVSKRFEWNEWLNTSDSNAPDYAQLLDMHPSRVEFYHD